MIIATIVELIMFIFMISFLTFIFQGSRSNLVEYIMMTILHKSNSQGMPLPSFFIRLIIIGCEFVPLLTLNKFIFKGYAVISVTLMMIIFAVVNFGVVYFNVKKFSSDSPDKE